MDWSLAGYKGHPIDGEATVVAASAGRLGGVAADIRGQITQLKGLGRAEEIWESTACSADKLQTALDELPEKLDLVATRYERVSEALDDLHPVLASAKQDAEYWIVQAEAAQDDAERAEAGVAEMEEHEDSDSEDEWEGEDHRAGLETAQGEAESAVANVRNAVEAFDTAAETCADAILDACNDNLQDHPTFTGSHAFAAAPGLAAADDDDTTQVRGLAAITEELYEGLGIEVEEPDSPLPGEPGYDDFVEDAFDPPPDEDSDRPFNEEVPDISDGLLAMELQYAKTWFMGKGYFDAAHYFDHWLKGSGDPKTIDPSDLMNDLEPFEEEVLGHVGDEAGFDSGWQDFGVENMLEKRR